MLENSTSLTGREPLVMLSSSVSSQKAENNPAPFPSGSQDVLIFNFSEFGLRKSFSVSSLKPTQLGFVFQNGNKIETLPKRHLMKPIPILFFYTYKKEKKIFFLLLIPD